MAIYYADSSTLVKRHANEIGSAWVKTIFARSANNTVITARISVVEVFSALNRRVRETTIQPPDYILIANDFTAICATEYQFVELIILVIDRARQLLERHPLRAYDSIQLASALLTNTALLTNGLSPLTFLAADVNLRNAAQAEGLTTDDPQAHP
jgi:predicted nucleic acid-binding protein